MRKAQIVNAIALLILAGLLATLHAPAQAADSWARLGVLPAGTSMLASDGANTSVLYSYGSGGIQRSVDGGGSWSLCNREARTMFVLTPLPGQSGSSHLYATTAGGLRTTDDGCKTWRDVPTSDISPSGAHIRWLATYPNNQSVMYAGLDGLGGLYRTTDAGTTWEAASNGLPAGAWVTSLVADPDKPTDVLISVKFARNSHPPTYIFRSTDGGVSWRTSGRGLYVTPNNDSAVTGIAWSGSNLLASTSYNGLYLSTDRGVSWAASTTPRGNGQATTGGAPTSLRIDSLQGTWEGALVMNTSEGAFGSMDGGRSWQTFGPRDASGRTAVVMLDENSGQALLGTGGSLYGYRIADGTTSVPTATSAPVNTATATPPLPPRVPTATPIQATATVQATPTIGPSPTIPVINGKKPTDKVDPLDPSIADYFADTGHNLAHGFRDFWKANGGVNQFGYPITEEFTENGVVVQYFQRARFEYRDGKVVLGRVGTELTQGQFFRPVPFFASDDTNAYFGATGHSVGGPFLTFWKDNGEEALLGYPLSESFKDDGSEYQWFERVRFEWHPYLPEGKRIVLGNVGTELLQARGWLPKD